MVANRVQLEKALELALQLSPLDKIRLVERLAYTLEIDIQGKPTAELSTDALPTWTDEEIQELLNLKPMSPSELVAWLDANPPAERWGNLRDAEDAAEYIHRTRRNTWSTPEDALAGDSE